jgi:UDP-glucose 4-epimerase
VIESWSGQRVLVTGGGSHIGSTVVEKLLARNPAHVRVADDFSTGARENISTWVRAGAVELIEGDLRDPGVAADAARGMSVVLHLAADHGGRGYSDLHPYESATNLGLESTVFRAALGAGVETISFASSGCVYPVRLQSNPSQTVYLTEDMAGPPFHPDGLNGLAKLAGELTLRALHDEHEMRTSSARFFNVYGPRDVESHAVMAMIARAYLRQDPFEIWGNGEQIRSWTYVDDVAEGMILCAERISDGTAVNLGTTRRVRVIDAANLACDLAEYEPMIELQLDKPTGVLNRVADNSLAEQMLGWAPQTTFFEGMRKTWAWYGEHKRPDDVERILESLNERLLGWAPQSTFVEGMRKTRPWYGEHRRPHEIERILEHHPMSHAAPDRVIVLPDDEPAEAP